MDDKVTDGCRNGCNGSPILKHNGVKIVWCIAINSAKALRDKIVFTSERVTGPASHPASSTAFGETIAPSAPEKHHTPQAKWTLLSRG